MLLVDKLLGSALLVACSTLVACAAETTSPEDPGTEDRPAASGPTSSPETAGTPGTPGGSASTPTTPGTPTPTDPNAPAPTAKFTGTATPEGCIANVAAGARTYTCEGLSVEATIPDMNQVCPAAGCGLIVELHGDTGNGAIMDQHLRLRERASAKGYIVVSPTGPAIGTINGTAYPGSTWNPTQDAKVVAITKLFAKVFKADPKRIHATGFSRGGHMTWRLGCDQSNLFASIAPGGAGNSSTQLLVNAPEPTCFQSGRSPARKLPILVLQGRTDALYAGIVSIKNAAMADYGITQAQVDTVSNDTKVLRQRTNKAGAPVVEWFDHGYEVAPGTTALFATAKGHCIPGSPVAPNAPQYAIACSTPSLDWGAEVLAFFERTPMP